MTTASEFVSVTIEAAPSWEAGWKCVAINEDLTRRDVFWSDADTLNDAIEEAIDRFDLPACRDNFGVDAREGWGIWERAKDGE